VVVMPVGHRYLVHPLHPSGANETRDHYTEGKAMFVSELFAIYLSA
jgi:hypothetical protein